MSGDGFGQHRMTTRPPVEHQNRPDCHCGQCQHDRFLLWRDGLQGGAPA